MPGRLLRVRAELRNQSCEILGLYQHALSSRTSTEKAKVMSQRKSLWKALDKTLSGLPFRAMLILGGDFNTCLETRRSVAGSGLRPGPQSHDLVQERQHVMDIFPKHRLVVLNSWGKKTPTYLHPSGDSQIDFVCVRQHAADKISRQTGPRQEGLAAWRNAGHVPLVGSLKAAWRPWLCRSTASCPKTSRVLGAHDRPAQRLREAERSFNLIVRGEQRRARQKKVLSTTTTLKSLSFEFLSY